MRRSPWWPPLPEAAKAWRGYLVGLVLVLLAGWLVLTGLFLQALFQGDAGIAKGGAAAAVLLLLVLMALAFPWLLLTVGLIVATVHIRRQLPLWFRPWRRRAVIAKHEARRWSDRAARPLVAAYRVGALVRGLVGLPQRLWHRLAEPPQEHLP